VALVFWGDGLKRWRPVQQDDSPEVRDQYSFPDPTRPTMSPPQLTSVGSIHASQSRYDWKWLSERYDLRHKGRIGPESFTNHPEVFARLDRDHNGVITADDLDWSENSAYVRDTQLAARWQALIDRNGNGRITQEEWDALFTDASKGKGHLTLDDLRELLNPPPSSLPPTPHKPPDSVVNAVKEQSQVNSHYQGPSLGDPAPDFSLQREDGRRKIALADVLGRKPIVLIFGSFT